MPHKEITVERLAQLIFAAYNGAGRNKWKTHDGRDVPLWEDLTDEVREKWKAAARFAQEIQKEVTSDNAT